jgi:hypothetical protein
MLAFLLVQGIIYMDINLRDSLTILTMLCTVVAWFVRLESKIFFNQERINFAESSITDLRLKYDESIYELTKTMNEIKLSQVRIETVLNIKQGIINKE